MTPGDGMMITPEVLDQLERRYLPAAEQKCVICGAPLTFSSSGEGGNRYNCSSAGASPLAATLRSDVPLLKRMEHYRGSAWTDRGEASPHVVELVRAYRAMAFPEKAS